MSRCNCSACGVSDGAFALGQESQSYTVVCVHCSCELPFNKLPLVCATCGSSNLGWRDEEGKWQQPNLSHRPNLEKTGIWIKGDFIGDYEGVLTSEKPRWHLRSQSPRIFDLRVTGGLLKNIIRVPFPPTTISSNEPLPIQQVRTNSIGAQYIGIDQFVQISLDDFRLHSWVIVAHTEVQPAAFQLTSRVIGRVEGTAYGHFSLTQDNTIETPPTIPENVSTPQSSSPSHNRNNLCADDQIAAYPPYKPCSICSPFLVMMSSALMWAVCSFKSALFLLLALSLTCILERILYNMRAKIYSHSGHFIFIGATVILSLISISVMGLIISKGSCGTVPIWLIAIPTIALISSAWTQSCLHKYVLAILLFIAIWLWCPGACLTSITISRTDINNTLNNIIHPEMMAPTYQSVTSVISSASQGVPGATHLSIDDALNNLAALGSCGTNLYFPNSVFFALDSDIIEPAGEEQFERLRPLFKYYANSHVIVTGHADKTGDGTPQGYAHNIELSERRATAVAVWFVRHGLLQDGEIEARGAGTKFPLTESETPEMVAFNRRVEIRLSCDPGRRHQ